MKKIILLTILIAVCMELNAQIWAIPNQYDDKVQTGEKSTQLDFYQFRFTGNTIDLKKYKKETGLKNIPDEIKIIPPDLHGFGDTTILITYMKEGPSDEGELIIWLTGNYLSNQVTFFVDKNMDGNYRNDGKPLVKKSKAKPEAVVMTPTDARKKTRVLSISVPERKLPAEYMPPKRYSKIKNKIAIGANAGIGVANLDFIYLDTELLYPTWYNVPITERNVGLSLTYNSRMYFLGIRGTFQSMNYWTAYFNKRLGEDREERNPNTGRVIVIENVDVKRNPDQHSNTRYQVGLLGGLRFALTKNLEIQPFGSYGTTFYGSEYYYPNKFDTSIKYRHESSRFVEGGIRFEFSISNYKTFYLGSSYTKLWWQPDGYFESLPTSNLEIDYHSYNITLGYRMSVF